MLYNFAIVRQSDFTAGRIIKFSTLIPLTHGMRIMPENKNSKNADGIYEPFATKQVPWEDFNRGKFGMRYRQLGEYGGGSKLGVCLEILEPGKQANQAHYHLLEEEHIYVLEGELTVQIGEKVFTVSADHYVCFPAGQTEAHAISNHTE